VWSSRFAFCSQLSHDVAKAAATIQLVFLQADTDVSDESVSSIFILIVEDGDNAIIRIPVYTVSQAKDYNVKEP
jgi:hypothetical protein